MIRLIVFDLDGTLVDSRRDLADAANRLIGTYGGRALPVDTIVTMVGEGVRLLVGRALAAAGVNADLDEAVAQFRTFYGDCLLVHTRPYPGVERMLAQVGASVPMAVLTNKPDDASRAVLDGLGLLRWFGRVVGGDSPWPRKPAPDGLLKLASDVGVEARETLLVGDSVIDRRTARGAGCEICLARYGFGFPAIPPGELDGGEWIIDAPEDLVTLLEMRGGVEVGGA